MAAELGNNSGVEISQPMIPHPKGPGGTSLAPETPSGIPMLPERSVLSPKVSEVETGLDEYIRGQGRVIRGMLRENGLGTVPVQDEVEVRDAGYFADRMTLGYVGIDKTQLSIVASSETDHHPLSVLLIAPTDEGSGLLVDDESGRVYTDSFWLMEGGTMKYIRPTAPVPLDRVSAEFDSPRDDLEIDTQEEKIIRRFDEFVKDKQAVKKLLSEAGIMVPQGEYISGGQSGDVSARLQETLAENNAWEVVVKVNDGYAGKNIVIGDPQSPQLRRDATRLVNFASTEDTVPSMLVEERVDTFPVLALGAHYDARLEEIGFGLEGSPTDPERIDWNVRVLTTVGQDSEVVDDEVRYNLWTGRPINVRKGARIVRTDILGSELAEQIRAVAQKATEVIFKKVAPGEDAVCSYAGVDVMVNRDGQVVVLEVNGLHSGGLASLAKLDGRPLASVSDTLLPAYVPVLQKQFAERPEGAGQILRPVEPNRIDMLSKARAYGAAGMKDNAAETVRQILSKYPQAFLPEWAKRYAGDVPKETVVVSLQRERTVDTQELLGLEPVDTSLLDNEKAADIFATYEMIRPKLQPAM